MCLLYLLFAALLALVDLCLEAVLDGADCAARVAIVAVKEVETICFSHNCVQRAAGRAHNIVFDIPADKTLNVLALEHTTDNKIPVLVNRPGCPKLREQKLTEMLPGTMKPVQSKVKKNR